jgi:hypothetical protein
LRDTPFRISGRVSGEEFFGRTESIREIVRQLRGKNNVAIVGAPKSGKTSLITVLFRNYKRAEKDVVTWFTDMKELDSLDDLVEEFYIGLGSQNKDHSLVSFSKTLKDFQKRLVIFLDSAERFALPPFNEEALFAVLASHLPTQSITICLASTLPPESTLTNKIGFPLHTLFTNYDLMPFTPDECYDLIQKKLQWTGIHFTEDEITELTDKSKGHPAELQRLAADLFREKMAKQPKGRG